MTTTENPAAEPAAEEKAAPSPPQTVDAQVLALQEQLAQAQHQAEALQHRVTQLAGYEGEVRSLRDGNASLQEQLDQTGAERDAAVRAAAQARSEASSAAASGSSDAAVVAAARKVAEGINGLLS